MLGEVFVTLVKLDTDIATFAAARLGGKSFSDLSSRQQKRYLKLRSADRDSVAQSLGTFGIVDCVIVMIVSLAGPFSLGLETDKSALVRYVILDSIDLAFVSLKVYNDSVLESQLFTILALHATDEVENFHSAEPANAIRRRAESANAIH